MAKPKKPEITLKCESTTSHCNIAGKCGNETFYINKDFGLVCVECGAEHLIVKMKKPGIGWQLMEEKLIEVGPNR